MPTPSAPETPDSYFRSPNLIAEWDRITFKDVDNDDLRVSLNQLKDSALNKLCDIFPHTDVSRRITEEVQEEMLSNYFDHLYENGLIPANWEFLCETTIRLYLDSQMADTTCQQRLEFDSFNPQSTLTPSGLMIFTDDHDDF